MTLKMGSSLSTGTWPPPPPLLPPHYRFRQKQKTQEKKRLNISPLSARASSGVTRKLLFQVITVGVLEISGRGRQEQIERNDKPYCMQWNRFVEHHSARSIAKECIEVIVRKVSVRQDRGHSLEERRKYYFRGPQTVRPERFTEQPCRSHLKRSRPLFPGSIFVRLT